MTKELSELLDTDRGAAILGRLQLLNLLASSPLDHDRAAEDRIGIWTARTPSGDFVRDAAADECLRWADVEVIRRRPGTHRILLIGESVARGFFLDPLYTCADALREAAARRRGDACEVVDLARTGLDGDGLIGVLERAGELNPSGIVVFAGNNWINDPPLAMAELGALSAALRTHGYAGLRRRLLARVERRATAIARRIGEIVGALGVPTAIVVPESNLADWRNDLPEWRPALEQAYAERWEELLVRGREALAAGAPDVSVNVAAEMLDLDGGISPVPYQLQAEAHASAGQDPAARLALQNARDCVAGLPLNAPPRCPTSVQAILRREFHQGPAHVVDLPRMLERTAAHGVPGREHFLDNCHLNDTGLRVAMTAAADALFSGSGAATELAWEAPSPQALASAHLMAAVHAAHYGQTDGLVAHHLDHVRRTGACGQQLASALLQYNASSAPAWASDSYERLLRHECIQRVLASRSGATASRLADYDLIRLLSAHGPPTARRLAHRNAVRLTDATGDVDLLSAPHAAPTIADHVGHDWGRGRRHGRASALPLMAFGFVVAQEPTRCDVEATVRSVAEHAPAGALRAELRLNGAHAGWLAIAGEWSDHRLQLDCKRLAQGVNRLELLWPHRVREGQRERDADRLERGILPLVVATFGEVSRLRLVVSPVEAVSGGVSAGVALAGGGPRHG